MIKVIDIPQLREILKQFMVNEKAWPKYVNTYKVLSPDSWIWTLSNDFPDFSKDPSLVVYVEDYLLSIEALENTIKSEVHTTQLQPVPLLRKLTDASSEYIGSYDIYKVLVYSYKAADE